MPHQSVLKAAEMYHAAATKYKIGQEFEKAAKTFELAAETYTLGEDRFGNVQARNLAKCIFCAASAILKIDG